MLVKDMIERMVYAGSYTRILFTDEINPEGNSTCLFESDNPEFVKTAFGNLAVQKWTVNGRGLFIEINPDINVYTKVNYVTTVYAGDTTGAISVGTGKTVRLSDEEYQERIKNWKQKRQEEVERKNQEFLSPEEYEQMKPKVIGKFVPAYEESDEEFEKRNQAFLESLNDKPDPSKYDNHDIRNLKLPARVMNRLTEFGIESVGDLRNFSRKDLLEVKGLAKRGVDIIEHRLYQLGLGLKKGE